MLFVPRVDYDGFMVAPIYLEPTIYQRRVVQNDILKLNVKRGIRGLRVVTGAVRHRGKVQAQTTACAYPVRSQPTICPLPEFLDILGLEL